MKTDEIAKIGLQGIGLREWYKNIILNDLICSPDDLLEVCFHKLKKEDKRLPINKYLKASLKSHTNLKKEAQENNFDKLISNTIRERRHIRIKTERTVNAIWDDQSHNFNTKLDLLAHLEESEIDVARLEKILIEIFKNDENILSSEYSPNVRRLIRVYDYIKFGQK